MAIQPKKVDRFKHYKYFDEYPSKLFTQITT